MMVREARAVRWLKAVYKPVRATCSTSPTRTTSIRGAPQPEGFYGPHVGLRGEGSGVTGNGVQ